MIIAACGDEPVALHLRDETPQPRAEVDALAVELDEPLRVSAALARCRRTAAERNAGGCAAHSPVSRWRPFRRVSARALRQGFRAASASTATDRSRPSALRHCWVRATLGDRGLLGSVLDSAERLPLPRARANCRAQTAEHSADWAAARCSTSRGPDRRPPRRLSAAALEHRLAAA